MTPQIHRSDVVAAARGWLGTPYHHQACARGVGCDCLGLIRGVWRDVTGSEPEQPPAYTPDWAEAGGRETLIEAARRHMIEVEPEAVLPGDVVIFRFRPRTMAKHAGILIGGSRMVHACSGRVVAEAHLGPWWRRRLTAAFRIPGVVD